MRNTRLDFRLDNEVAQDSEDDSNAYLYDTQWVSDNPHDSKIANQRDRQSFRIHSPNFASLDKSSPLKFKEESPKTSGHFEMRAGQELARVEVAGEIIERQEKTKMAVYSPHVPVAELLAADKLLIRRSWRSLPLHWVTMPILGYAGIELSEIFPDSVLRASISLSFIDVQIFFPLFIIPLFLVMLHAFEKIYNRHIILDPEYLVYYRGNHSFNREICDMETASMQVVSVKQKPWEALLGVGNVALGRFSRKGMEFDLYGIANPYRLARLLKLSVLRARRNSTKVSERLQDSDEDEYSDNGDHY